MNEIKFKNNKKLCNTGLFVSELCLGTGTFQKKAGNSGPLGIPSCDEETSYKILNEYAGKGGNFIDTANAYLDSEEIIGNWLQGKRRDDFIIESKVRLPVGPGVNDVGLSRKHIMWSIENSLKKLQTDYLDIFFVHAWDMYTPIQETFRALNDLVRSGKIHYIGISNFTGWQLQAAVDLCNYTGLNPIVSVQPQYNLLCREVEYDILEVCKYNNLAVLPWSPLASGWLAGKVNKQGHQLNSRIDWAQKAKLEVFNYGTTSTAWKTIEEAEAVAMETGRTPAQVSIRWLMQKPLVTSPIIGSRTVEQVKDNMGAIEFELTQEQMTKLNSASDVEIPYPWGPKWTFPR